MVVSTPLLPLQLDYVRQQFPSLSDDWVLMDNAGGSQIARSVIQRMQEYLTTSNVQLGASYAISQQAGQRVAAGNQVAATLMNAAETSEVVMGPSSSMLLRILALCLGQTWQPGDEVIVTNCDHEANISPWMDLQKQGIQIKVWPLNPETLELHLEDLEPLMGPRTRLVALTHASNILGTINPIQAIANRVHQRGAMICVDGVGYVPHRLVDVQALDVDFYVFSFYKVYGPHHAVLYGKREHLLALPGFNHYFIGQEDIPYKFQPGGANYELSYSIVGLGDYLGQLATHHRTEQTAPDGPEQNLGEQEALRKRMQQAFDLITVHEEQLSDRLLSSLKSNPRVRIVGHPTGDRTKRVPTIAFTVDGVDSATIPRQLDAHRIGTRYGDFYAKRLIQDLGLAAQNGVVRVSMVHYNTLDECDRLIAHLEPLL